MSLTVEVTLQFRRCLRASCEQLYGMFSSTAAVTVVHKCNAMNCVQFTYHTGIDVYQSATAPPVTQALRFP